MNGFFVYAGGKWRHAKDYPPPRFGRIVEPFAGSAGYAGKYYHLPVQLYDVSPVICGIWEYIIKTPSKEILALPLKITSLGELPSKIPQEAKWLIGFWLQRGGYRPKQTPCSWTRSGNWKVHFWGEEKRNRIAAQAELIRHWKIRQLSYEKISILSKSDWFVDPPYRGFYKYDSPAIDYDKLGAWLLFGSWRGQIIVCENSSASWLPFSKLYELRAGSNNYKSEGVFIRITL